MPMNGIKNYQSIIILSFQLNGLLLHVIINKFAHKIKSFLAFNIE